MGRSNPPLDRHHWDYACFRIKKLLNQQRLAMVDTNTRSGFNSLKKQIKINATKT